MKSRKGIENKSNKYETDILPRLEEIKTWVENGDSVREICRKLKISPDTWYRYQAQHENLSELISMGRCVLLSSVEKSLAKLCLGYEYEELKTIVEEDKLGKKHTKLEKVKRYQPPSPQAISFFLKNRCPEDWADKKEIVIENEINEVDRKKLFLSILNGTHSDDPADD